MKKFTFFLFFAVIAILTQSSNAYGQIAQRGVATNATGTTSLVINKPTGVVSGDVMIVNIAQSGPSGAGELSNPTSLGWTLIDGRDLQGGTKRWGAVMYKVAGGSEPANYTFTLDAGGNSAAGSIVAFSGVDVTGGVLVGGGAGGPFDVNPGTLNVTDASTATATAKTTVSANAAVIMFAEIAGSGSASTTFSSWTIGGSISPFTELYDNGTTTGDDASVGAAWGIKATAGSTGTGTVNLSPADRSGAIIIALKPVPGAPSVTLSPSTTQNIMPGESVNFTASAINYPAGGNYTYTWSVSPAATIPGSNPNVIAATSDTKAITFAAPGTYTVNVNITRASTSINLTTSTVTINVLAPNLWSGSGTGAIRKYVADPNSGVIIAGPSVVATPLTSTAAVAKNQVTGTDAEGCIYYLNRDENDLLNGVVTIYSMRPDGSGHGIRGTIDMNGAGNDADFSFVRFGFDAIGRGWILAGADATNNIYIASFDGNGINPISGVNTFGNTSLTVAAPGTASEFQNGDLAITANGTLYVLANVTDGATHIYTLNSLITPTTLTRKWTVVPAANTTFSGSVNGLAWTQTGSLYFSTSSSMYFIDQATVNNSGPGTVQASLVPNTTGLGLTDLASDKFPQQTTLPVTLLSFGGTYKNQVTVLNWATENLKDFDYFEIERSENGLSFTAIGVKEPINTLDRATYQFADNLTTVTGSVFYYRLKMVDLNGAVKYSHIILVRKDGTLKDVTISPNPVHAGAMATIRFEANRKGVATLKVVDMSGRSILTQSNSIAEGANSIPLTNLGLLQSGMYVLVVNDGATMQTTKFQVSK
jgi:hypothetical protein